MMKKNTVLLVSTYLFCLTTVDVSAEVNWRRGSLYFKQVCNACHLKAGGKAIAPNSLTKAEWHNYIKAGNHANSTKTSDRLSVYTSKDYRELMEPSIQAVVLFFDQRGSDILLDIEAHLVHHAKDSDMPSNCQD